MLVEVNVEFRGQKSRKSKAGKSYVMANAEDSDGNAFSIYCLDSSVLTGINKGDSVKFLCDLELNGKYPHFNLVGVK